MSWHLLEAQREESFLAAILDHLAIPILIADRNAVVEYANQTAQGVAGGETSAIDDILQGPSKDNASRLRAVITDTCVHGVGHAITMGQEQPRSIVAITIPFQGEPASGDGRAMVLLCNGVELSDVLLGSLRELFKLSTAQAEIAIALGSGANINEVARERGVKRNTLRSQLASIMERTGTHRQAELVALIAKIGALL